MDVAEEHGGAVNYYVSTPTGARCLAACRANGYREMACPVRTRVERATGARVLVRRPTTPSLGQYALDNGAWIFHEMSLGADFQPFIDALVTIGPRADFVAVPDIVAGGLDSLRLSARWLPWVLAHTELALVPVQDGMEPGDVATMVGPRVGIFVGGSFDWKWTTVSSWARFARERGVYIHVGRVNSAKRSNLCADLGVDSCDGSTVARFSKTASRMVRAVDPNRHAQGHLL